MHNPLEYHLDNLAGQDFARIEEYLFYNAKAAPEREACVDSNRRLTYKELNIEVEQCANALAQIGVGSNDFVAALLPPGTSFWITYLATQLLGAIWVGINPKYTEEEIKYILEDSAPKVLFAQLYCENGVQTKKLQNIRKHGFKHPIIIFDLDTDDRNFVAYCNFCNEKKHHLPFINTNRNSMMVYTSGSTGKPKGALIPHESLIRAGRIRHTIWHQKPIRALLNVPVNHIGGAGDIACTTLISGGTLVCMEKFDSVGTLEIIENEKLTYLYQTPTQLQLVFQDREVSQYDLSSLNAVIWSGARASAQLVDTLASLFPSKLATDYSMTESVGAIAMTPLTQDLEILKNTVGWPVPSRGIDIIPDTREIVLNDSFIMSTYYKRPDATAKTIRKGGVLHTGDLAETLPNGCVKLVGRKSNMFKSGGYNIYPAEVEKVLESHSNIAFAALISVPDTLWGEVGHAFVTPITGKVIEIEAMNSFCRDKLANYKIPKRITVLKEMPRLNIGKIDRGTLKEKAMRKDV